MFVKIQPSIFSNLFVKPVKVFLILSHVFLFVLVAGRDTGGNIDAGGPSPASNHPALSMSKEEYDKFEG